jgi:hypothetical protein
MILSRHDFVSTDFGFGWAEVQYVKICHVRAASFLEHAIGFLANVTDPRERVPTNRDPGTPWRALTARWNEGGP